MSLNIFLDRDGTIIEDKHYLSSPGGVALLPGAAEALQVLTNAGARLFVVTNQSGIGRNYFTLADYKSCKARLDEIFKNHKISIKGTAFCPHVPEDSCLCRKPATGMWQKFEEEYSLNPCKTIMIGDKLEDVLFGLNSNFSTSILVLTGKGAGEIQKGKVQVTDEDLKLAANEEVVPANLKGLEGLAVGEKIFVAKNLLVAANWIIKKRAKDYKC